MSRMEEILTGLERDATKEHKPKDLKAKKNR